MDDEVLEVPSVGALPKKAPKVMNWTPPMSAMMLKGLSEVAERGAKTNKGFKEAAKLKVAKCICAFVGYDMSITQVHNHIRKWRNRIIQQMLNFSIPHLRTTTIWKIALLISKPPGIMQWPPVWHWETPIVVEDKDKPNVMEGHGTTDEVLQHLPGSSSVLPTASATQDPSPTSNKKRKRASGLTEKDTIQCSNMTDAMREIASAINNTCHAETHPDLYKAVMDLIVFDQNDRLAILDYLTKHKAKSLDFVKMNDEVHKASFKRTLKANPYLL
uniref:Myb/SANT-like domain-containing protein n=1 Tax=Aegilops tauschii TaxID=37682 RepID=M8BX81_AEGTA